MRGTAHLVQDFSLEWWKCFQSRQRRCLHNIMNVLNAPELVTLEWVIVCYVTITSIFLKKPAHFHSWLRITQSRWGWKRESVRRLLQESRWERRVTWTRVVMVEEGRGRKCREKCPEEYSLKWDPCLSLSGGSYVELLSLFKLFTAIANTQQNHLGGNVPRDGSGKGKNTQRRQRG